MKIQLRRILVPTDFSEAAGDAIRHAAAIARWSGAELLVLHVVEKFMDHSLLYSDVWPFQKPVHEYYRELEERTEEQLARQMREAAADVPFRVFATTGGPAAEILGAARSEAVDLIVISAHGRGGIADKLLGSTTDRVLRRAPCAVLVLREGAGFVHPDGD